MENKLIKSSLLFSFVTSLSRVFGYLRDMVAVSVFGASPGYDVFLLASKIPNLLRRLFAEGAFSQAFVPVLVEVKTNAPDFEKRFINKISGNLVLVLSVIVILGIIFTPYIIRIVAPGFIVGEEKYNLAVCMLRITFPYIFFISMVAMGSGILNSHGSFAIPAFMPIILNIAMLIGSLTITGFFLVPEFALAISFIIGGLAQLLFIAWCLKKQNLLPKLEFDWQDKFVKRVMAIMLPAMFGGAIGQINSLVDTIFASRLVSGTLSWLYCAERLMDLPLGIIASAVATVLLPALSKSFAANQIDKFNIKLIWGLKIVLLFGVPSAGALYVLGFQFVTLLFKGDKFLSRDVMATTIALQAYCWSIIGVMIAKVFSSAFYSFQKINIPVRVNVLVLFLNIILNYLLIDRYAHVGLAISTSISALVNGFLLGILWYIKSKYDIRLILMFAMKIIIASVIMCCMLNYLLSIINVDWLLISKIHAAMYVACLIIAGIICYGSMIIALGIRPKELII